MTDYIVKDISLADFGNKEIAIAETEMPGLMAIRDAIKGVSEETTTGVHRLYEMAKKG